MNARVQAAFAVLLVLALMQGCSSMQRVWYRCDLNRFSGFEYAGECRRLAGWAP
jgi:hypothetical protein